MNPNKATKDKLMGGGQKDKKSQKDKKDKSSKTIKLQLKGRIFMTNVTDVVSMVKPGLFALPPPIIYPDVIQGRTRCKFGGKETLELRTL